MVNRLSDEVAKLLQDLSLQYAKEFSIEQDVLQKRKDKGNLMELLELMNSRHRSALMPLVLPHNKSIAKHAYKVLSKELDIADSIKSTITKELE